MKIITYNVNGIRAAVKKGLVTWLATQDADVLCFQELKAITSQIPLELFTAMGYTYHAIHAAQKAGYSGVAIFSKKAPLHIEIGCGIDKYDQEGRVIRADFENCSVMSVYMPSGTSGEERQQFKYEWLDDFYDYIQQLIITYPRLVIVGDYNIAHQEMDIHNPKSNKNSSGFLPAEREWLTKFYANGFTDAFRHLHPHSQEYTWWSSRSNAREKNLGWRIDYMALTTPLIPQLKHTVIHAEAVHSDHCPMSVLLNS
jgi:exodeoxyribonuclease-3